MILITDAPGHGRVLHRLGAANDRLYDAVQKSDVDRVLDRLIELDCQLMMQRLSIYTKHMHQYFNEYFVAHQRPPVAYDDNLDCALDQFVERCLELVFITPIDELQYLPQVATSVSMMRLEGDEFHRIDWSLTGRLSTRPIALDTLGKHYVFDSAVHGKLLATPLEVDLVPDQVDPLLKGIARFQSHAHRYNMASSALISAPICHAAIVCVFIPPCCQ